MPYRRILVPITGGDDDYHVINLAGVLAERKSAEVTFVFVVEVKQALPLDAALPEYVATGESALEHAERFARDKAVHRLQKVTSELLQARAAGAAIVDEAIARESDLVMLACRNRYELGKTTVGDTASYVLRNAPCEVILVRVAPD